MEKIPECSKSSMIPEDARFLRLFEAMEASWQARKDQNLPRASFPEDLSQLLEFRCAAAASWHWGNPVSNHRKRELQKHAKAAINQTDRLSSRWKALFETSSTVPNLLDAFELVVPGIVWARPEHQDYDPSREDEEVCASDVEQEMFSTRLRQAHCKETTEMYQKIANLSYVQTENKKVHWKLTEVLASFNNVRFALLYVAYDML
jgi:hypothetical protein